jgi:hypothetical protein
VILCLCELRFYGKSKNGSRSTVANKVSHVFHIYMHDVRANVVRRDFFLERLVVFR